jgi:hypothetical protein
MTPEEFNRLYPSLLNWISQTLAAHQSAARSVASAGFRRLPDFFSNNLLATAKVVAIDILPIPPLAEMGLSQFAPFFGPDIVGITYLDTFFVREGHQRNEELHFHELVHVVQWRRLGPELFLKVYAQGLKETGYRDSFLEKMAFDLQARFQSSPEPFAAEQQVDEMLKKAGLTF